VTDVRQVGADLVSVGTMNGYLDERPLAGASDASPVGFAAVRTRCSVGHDGHSLRVSRMRPERVVDPTFRRKAGGFDHGEVSFLDLALPQRAP
jgi:hypothetical protein